MPAPTARITGPQSFTANGQTSNVIDTTDAETIAIQVTSSFTGSFVAEQSLNGTNWTGIPLQSASSPGTGASSTITNPGTNTILQGPVVAPMARIRISSYTSGTFTVIVAALAEPITSLTLPSAGTATPGDGAANPTNAVPDQAYNMLWNGTTWDRARTAGNVTSGASAAAVATGNNPQTTLNGVVAVTNGTTVDLGASRANHSVNVGGSFVANVRLQITHDGVTWRDIAVINVNDTAASPTKMLDITAVGLYVPVQPIPARYVRASVTSFTSGSVTAQVASAG